ncbi:MAG: hypothetical protein HYZ01_03090 [Ignavibacteriales bacterium]|nr:hypothetical protein [Ignavibacteriales bacterium]
MNRAKLLWMLSFALTLLIAFYQRVTGPSYPVSGSCTLGGVAIPFKFDRSHGGDSDVSISIRTNDDQIRGVLDWRRFKTADSWRSESMLLHDGVLSAMLPHQLPAGKLQYRVRLTKGELTETVPAAEPVTIRFKGAVPMWILIPHVIIMFSAMLFSSRTGLEFFNSGPNLKKLASWTVGLLFLGGLLLGPAMQWHAFNAWWTGWPFGTDLTDNKTAVALAGWLVALMAIHRRRHSRAWALGASLVLLLVYLIPHSMLGSELDYTTQDQQQTVQPKPE